MRPIRTAAEPNSQEVLGIFQQDTCLFEHAICQHDHKVSTAGVWLLGFNLVARRTRKQFCTHDYHVQRKTEVWYLLKGCMFGGVSNLGLVLTSGRIAKQHRHWWAFRLLAAGLYIALLFVIIIKFCIPHFLLAGLALIILFLLVSYLKISDSSNSSINVLKLTSVSRLFWRKTLQSIRKTTKTAKCNWILAH